MWRDTVSIYSVCEESYSVSPTLLSFITKLNSNQINIKK